MTTASQVTRQQITALLEELPPESLDVVQRFVQFLYEQAQRGQPVAPIDENPKPPYSYPTVSVPPSVLDGLVGLMPPIGGDALAETEALYDTD